MPDITKAQAVEALNSMAESFSEIAIACKIYAQYVAQQGTAAPAPAPTPPANPDNWPSLDATNATVNESSEQTVSKFYLSEPRSVAFEADGGQNFAVDLPAGVHECALPFGGNSNDPKSFTAKICRTLGPTGTPYSPATGAAPPPPAPAPAPAPTPQAPAAGTLLANQHGSFTLAAPTRVAYGGESEEGKPGGWHERDVGVGTHVATDDPTEVTNPLFNDYAFAILKRAVSMGPATGEPERRVNAAPWSGSTNPPAPAPSPSPSPSPAPAPAPAPAAGDLPSTIVDANGNLVTSAFDAIINARGSEAYVDFIHGKAATDTSGGTKLFQRPIKKFPDNATNGGQRNELYEFGEYKPDDQSSQAYSTVQGEVIGTSPVDGDAGVAVFQAAAYTSETGSVSPQPAWQLGYVMKMFHLDEYRAKQFLAASGDIKPLCVVSSNDFAEENGTSRLIVTADGWVLGGGSNTAGNFLAVKLDSDFAVTHACIPSKSEFMILVGASKSRRVGQMKIMALAGMAHNLRWDDPETGRLMTDNHPLSPGIPAQYEGGMTPLLAVAKEMWWAEGKQVTPGRPNMGNVCFAKTIATIDIPGMFLPTTVAMTTGFHSWEMIDSTPGIQNPYPWFASPLRNHLDKFRPGGKYYDKQPRGGTVVINAMVENKSVVVDLKKLYDLYDNYYFGANPSMAYRDKVGLGATQFPPVLTSNFPVDFVKTFTWQAKPTFVIMSGTIPSPNSGSTREAWAAVGFDDGKVSVIGLGDYVPGSKIGKQGQPSQLRVTCTVDTGFGRLSSASGMYGFKLLDNTSGDIDSPKYNNNNSFHMVGRGQRMGGGLWIADNLASASVFYRFVPHKDQCLDPIYIMDVANYSNRSNTQHWLDHNGMRLCGFRTDTLVHNGAWKGWPQYTPVTPTNGVKIEHTGILNLKFKPVLAKDCNVP